MSITAFTFASAAVLYLAAGLVAAAGVYRNYRDHYQAIPFNGDTWHLALNRNTAAAGLISGYLAILATWALASVM